jgi:hypothetical protein
VNSINDKRRTPEVEFLRVLCELLHPLDGERSAEVVTALDLIGDRIIAIMQGEHSSAGDATAEKDEAYRQRNVLVAALARLYPSGVRRTSIEGWSSDWHGCVYIDLPSGQISYHYHDSQSYLFLGLPAYTKPWDGHDKAAVEQRLSSVSASKDTTK